MAEVGTMPPDISTVWTTSTQAVSGSRVGLVRVRFKGLGLEGVGFRLCGFEIITLQNAKPPLSLLLLWLFVHLCIYVFGSFPKEGDPNIDPKIL